jgi:hypothetical protein
MGATSVSVGVVVRSGCDACLVRHLADLEQRRGQGAFEVRSRQLVGGSAASRRRARPRRRPCACRATLNRAKAPLPAAFDAVWRATLGCATCPFGRCPVRGPVRGQTPLRLLEGWTCAPAGRDMRAPGSDGSIGWIRCVGPLARQGSDPVEATCGPSGVRPLEATRGLDARRRARHPGASAHDRRQGSVRGQTPLRLLEGWMRAAGRDIRGLGSRRLHRVDPLCRLLGLR